MKILYIILTLFLFSLIGTAVGELLLQILPVTGKIHEIVSANLTPVWSVEKLDILILYITFKVGFNFNIMTFVGLISGCFFSLRKV
ncbi:hypothetical protein M0P98_06920 [bacterium]|nr:hypothetical protein [bacterium]